VSEAFVAGGDYEAVGFGVDKDFGGHQLDCARQRRASRDSRGLTGSLLIGVRGGWVDLTPLHLSLRGARMDTAGSFLLLLILAVLIFGLPILLLAIRLIETISEMRESAEPAEGESTAEGETTVEKKAPAEKSPTDDAGEWTPVKHMR
jgi:hypothetical protein